MLPHGLPFDDWYIRQEDSDPENIIITPFYIHNIDKLAFVISKILMLRHCSNLNLSRLDDMSQKCKFWQIVHSASWQITMIFIITTFHYKNPRLNFVQLPYWLIMYFVTIFQWIQYLSASIDLFLVSIFLPSPTYSVMNAFLQF